MNTLVLLERQAIKAAQEQKWDQAIEHNTKILEEDPRNISALNRLGFCYLQTQKSAKAKASYQAVLKIDPYNPIASKYMRSGFTQTAPSSAALSYADFIEEPGKTKTVQLCRVADQKILEKISIASVVELVQKSHCIAVETQNHVHIGTLPDDLSFRLKKLLKGGNTYKVIVKSIGKNHCSIFIKEVKRSKKFQYIASFPGSISNHATNVHENLAVMDTIEGEVNYEEETPALHQDDDDDLMA